jgi:hypothetical protein
VAISNVAGGILVFLMYVMQPMEVRAKGTAFYLKGGVTLTMLAMSASMRYHMIETRMGQLPLEGVEQSEVDSALSADRFIAFLSIIYCFLIFMLRLQSFHEWAEIVMLTMLAFTLLLISENKTLRDEVFMGKRLGSLNVYCVFHCMWHLMAFYLLGRAVRLE